MLPRCIKSYRIVEERSRKSFDSNTESLKQDYLDIFEGVKSDVIYSVQYDESSDLGTTYIGIPKMRRQDEWKKKKKHP